MLEALEAEWLERPPVHLLVRAYLGYEPGQQPPADNSEQDPAGEAAFAPPPGTHVIPGSDAMRQATTSEEALSAAETLFFGKVATHVEQLRRPRV
ncbi:MAG: hypothetical protein ACOZJZ_12650 [Pseudomonadota bacterium]